jgi:hypothetical protein
MTAESSTANDEQETSSFEATQTSPLRLTDYDGCDHRGALRLTFDESTLPDYENKAERAADLDWALEAINAVIHYPNLALWLRTPYKDLLVAITTPKATSGQATSASPPSVELT